MSKNAGHTPRVRSGRYGSFLVQLRVAIRKGVRRYSRRMGKMAITSEPIITLTEAVSASPSSLTGRVSSGMIRCIDSECNDSTQGRNCWKNHSGESRCLAPSFMCRIRCAGLLAGIETLDARVCAVLKNTALSLQIPVAFENSITCIYRSASCRGAIQKGGSRTSDQRRLQLHVKSL